MAFTLRPYQVDAVGAGVDYFTKGKAKHKPIEILTTGSGKSVVIASITKELPGKSLILQPNTEILTQNLEKFLAQGLRAGVYSSSAGSKFIDNVTFATIGSIVDKPHLFDEFDRALVDECHLVNPEKGMYYKLFNTLDHLKIMGFTATPYRLCSSMEGSELRFITRQSPRIFNKVAYYIQNSTLFEQGHLAPLKYFPMDEIDRTRLKLNSSGSDFTEASIKSYFREVGMAKKTIHYANRVLAKRKNLLIFCGDLTEAYEVAKGVPGSVVIDGDTAPAVRVRCLKEFKAGKIRCVINVKVLDTGFDFPGLEAVLISKITMSLAVYYQIVGRVMRFFRYPDGSIKEGWVVDLGGNISLFGRIETMKIEQDDRGLYKITNNGRQLTNVPFTRNIAA